MGFLKDKGRALAVAFDVLALGFALTLAFDGAGFAGAFLAVDFEEEALEADAFEEAAVFEEAAAFLGAFLLPLLAFSVLIDSLR